MDNTCIRQKIRDYQTHKQRLVKVRTILDTGRRGNPCAAGSSQTHSRFEPPMKSRLNPVPVAQNTASTFMTSVAVNMAPGENFHKREAKKTDNILKDNVVCSIQIASV